jgi:hypothetical protein
LAQRLRVRLRRVVGAYPVQGRCIAAAADPAAPWRGRAALPGR